MSLAGQEHLQTQYQHRGESQR
ncbi:hypothetical protein D043_3992A, partial [Vibrio parahaemolyticus EKP-021]